MRRWISASVLLGLLASVALSGELYTVEWSAISSGGVVRSQGGNFDLSGSIGQPHAGSGAGGDFKLNAGFWLSLAATDCNDDGTVDSADFRALALCLTGPGGIDAADCDCFDVDANGFIDLRDFARAQVAFSAD